MSTKKKSANAGTDETTTTKGSKKRKAVSANPAPAIEPEPADTPTANAEPGPDVSAAIETATETTPEEKKPAKSRSAKSDATLADVAEGYLKHMEESGKSAGTSFSYRLELTTALKALGAETAVRSLTPERVLEFFVSDTVMRTRTGVQKAKPTVDKTRRVLRLALLWAEEKGLVEKAPVPELAATY